MNDVQMSVEAEYKDDGRIDGATGPIDAAACAIWAEMCPGMVMGDEDRAHYEAAAAAALKAASFFGAIEPAERGAVAVVAAANKVVREVNLFSSQYPLDPALSAIDVATDELGTAIAAYGQNPRTQR